MNHYAKAIDLLESDLDHRAIVVDYAKRHPAAFIKAASVRPSLREECLAFLEAKKKINAIKHYRTVTGASLKEAKEAVEAMV